MDLNAPAIFFAMIFLAAFVVSLIQGRVVYNYLDVIRRNEDRILNLKDKLEKSESNGDEYERARPDRESLDDPQLKFGFWTFYTKNNDNQTLYLKDNKND